MRLFQEVSFQREISAGGEGSGRHKNLHLPHPNSKEFKERKAAHVAKTMKYMRQMVKTLNTNTKRDPDLVRSIKAGGPPANGGPGSGNYQHQGKAKLSDKDLENKFRGELHKDWEGSKAKYTARWGNQLSADDAKEMSPDYLEDRGRAMAVHEPVSEMMKELYAEWLAKPQQPGKDNDVLFTAGAPGSGKTTALENDPSVKSIKDQAHLVYDMTMADPKSGAKKIDQARAAGKGVRIAYVYRDPVEAVRNGILKRADRQEKQFGSGRIVPIDEAASQHAKMRASMKELTERYKGDPEVHIVAIDNSRGPGKAKMVDFKDLPKMADDAPTLEKKMAQAADEEYANGRISEHVWRSFKSKSLGTHS